MEIFNQTKLNGFISEQKKNIAVFACVTTLLITGFVLFCVFSMKIPRAWAQTGATVCIVAAGCYTLFFVRLNIFLKRMKKNCKLSESTELIVANITSVDNNITTYRLLPFHAVDALCDGQLRRLYLWEGSLKTNVNYKLKVSQNIICGYEEEL